VIVTLVDFGARKDGISIDLSSHLKVQGFVKKNGISIPCRVRIFEKLSGAIIQDVVTDHNGKYTFSNLGNMVFFVVAHDPASHYNAVIQDNVVPK
jgi:hypothetical protein